MQNLCGGGESLKLQLSQSWNQNREDQLAFYKSSGGHRRILYARLTRLQEAIPWQQMSKRQFDGSLGLIHDPWDWLQHQIGLNASIRHLFPISRHSSELPFSSRLDSGYSLKSSLTHELTIDTRDHRSKPSRGLLLKLFQEFTGPLGNVSFVKQTLDVGIYVPLAKNWTLNWSSRLGALTDTLLGSSFNGINSSDYVGFNHSLNCRGWSNSKFAALDFGDRRNFKHQILAASSLKLFFPLPLLRTTKSWLAQTFQPQVFLDYGLIGKTDDLQMRTLLQASSSAVTSLSYGIGMSIKLGDVGRAEVNYCVPVRSFSSHATGSGLQFGMGINFL